MTSRATPPQLAMLVAVIIFAVPLSFYGHVYFIHHDLAGGVMSGRFSVAVGDAFDRYSLYFPPIEKFWFTTATHLSDATGLRPDLSIILMTSAVILVSTLLADRVRREAGAGGWLFLAGSVAVFLLVPVLFKNVFGLREHIVALGLWPYVVLRLYDADKGAVSLRTRMLVGLWLGATLLFKVFYAILVLLIEAIDAALQRSPATLFRTENLLSGAIVAAYLFAWLVLRPEQREAIGASLSAIDANLIDPKTNWMTALSKMPPVVFFLLGARVFSWPLRRTLIGLALVVGALIVSAIQARWYTHHVFPITMAYLACWWLVHHQMKWWAHLAASLLILPAIVPQFLSTSSYQRDVRELAASIRDAGQSIEGKRVGVLSVHPAPYNQYLGAFRGERWIGAVNNSYVAAELARHDLKEKRGELAPPVVLDDPGRRAIHEQMLRLWEDLPPDVLILDASQSWPLRYIEIDWLHVFANDARFAAILANYRPVFRYDGERVKYRYFVRKAPADGSPR